ncbi:conjugative transfer region protein TrbK [Rhodobium orientis]|uniref:Conjugal transfer protein TrbK n=1 Tax=Rhodobium orientis TaxID=34017 RepID=A0A327JNK8_9HYPH|nr:putative entry exclusion protein TrbK-alt [Rhodobium orientis]MBB4303151.1 conjugative transfer region protein TrbK [Rhodobium orientis]MBK5951747.1 conjugal transfer protein TrbK [Rhodobium orientis]RAI26924.1 conjugal transfer protein TrbK [Rhodobium orientis]
MDGKTLARIAAIAFVAVAITATVLELTQEPEPLSDAVSAPAPTWASDVDLVRRELRRCQRLGEAATRDRDCLAAWSENRQRFLGIEAERP